MTGKYLSKTVLLPPTIMAKVPDIAPGSPPLTGASSSSIPFFLHSEYTFFATIGLIELISIITDPDCAPSKTPFVPKTTFSTSGPSGSIVIIRVVF